MSFPRYPKYKDSGVEWLGEVPEHWEVAKFRHRFRESPEKIEDTVVGPMLSVSGYRGIEVKEYDDDNRRRSDEDLVGYRIVRKGQLVVNTMWLNYAGLGVSEYEGHVSPAYRSYDFAGGFEGRYAHHLLRSSTYVQGYTQLLTGVRPNSLQMSRDDLMDFPVLVPPRVDQGAIASFLDHETAKIDDLVTEQQRLIELLKEKRQAAISHAVTKGLNPDAPMKPSGVEWLGEVPAHWEVVPLKSLVSLKHGYAFEGEAFSFSGEYVLMTPGNFEERGGFRAKVPEKFYTGDIVPEEFVLRHGQLLVAMTEQAPGLLGAALFVPDGATYLHNQRIGVVQCLGTQKLTETFLFYTFNSFPYRTAVSLSATGAKVRHTSPERMLTVRVPLPSLTEQRLICSLLDSTLSEIDRLEADSQRMVRLLQERRSALISAAVTGRIDVRHLPTEAAA